MNHYENAAGSTPMARRVSARLVIGRKMNPADKDAGVLDVTPIGDDRATRPVCKPSVLTIDLQQPISSVVGYYGPTEPTTAK